MYIHNYQIHNVLDVYRKQLSQTATTDPHRGSTASMRSTSASPTGPNPRQVIIDRVSAEIVERFGQEEPRDRFAENLIQAYGKAQAKQQQRDEAHFTYTEIDANDRKITNTLPVEKINPLLGRTQSMNRAVSDMQPEPITGE